MDEKGDRGGEPFRLIDGFLLYRGISEGESVNEDDEGGKSHTDEDYSGCRGSRLVARVLCVPLKATIGLLVTRILKHQPRRLT